MATIKEDNEVMQEMKQNLAQKIKDDVLALLEKYKQPCLALKMSINIDASVNIVHYSGNGRRSNPPMTIAETKANYNTHGITNWNEMKDYADGLYWFINSVISDVIIGKIIVSQNTWLPSEEQINALYEATLEGEPVEALETLLSDLKKLRGE